MILIVEKQTADGPKTALLALESGMIAVHVADNEWALTVHGQTHIVVLDDFRAGALLAQAGGQAPIDVRVVREDGE